MSTPKASKDKQGRWTITGVQDRVVSQQTVDYNELRRSAELLPPSVGQSAQAILRDNPLASGGILAGLVENGSMPDNQLAKSLIDIDQLTKADRARDAFEERRRLETEKFKTTLFGKVWQTAKFATRGLFEVGNALVQGLNAGVRDIAQVGEQILSIPKFVDGVRKGEVDWLTGNSKIPGKTAEELGYFGGRGNTYLENNLEEITLFQGIKELAQTGRINFGEGFFASEEFGAGFKARQAQLEDKALTVKLSNGKTYQRPYNAVDPITNLITGGNADTGLGTLVSTLGEVLLFWRLDPTIAYSKISRQVRELRNQVITTEGKTQAKKIVELANAEAELEAAVQKSARLFDEYGISPDSTAEEVLAAYNRSLEESYELGARVDQLVDSGYDAAAIGKFLSSSKAEAILDTLAEMDTLSILRLGKAGPRKMGIGVDAAQALGAATTRDEVLRAIAPYINNGSVVANVLETGTVSGRLLSKLVAGVDNLVPNSIKGNAARVVKQSPYIYKFGSAIGRAYDMSLGKPIDYVRRAYNTVVPSKSAVHYLDKDLMVQNIEDYARIAKVSDDKIDKLVLDFINEADPRVAAFNAATNLMQEIVAANGKSYVNQDELKKITKIFDRAKEEMSVYWADRHAAGARLDYIMKDGTVMPLSGPHLESELLNSMIYFPNAKDLLDTISFSNKLKLGRISAGADWLIGNVWKKFILVRPAYVIRNIIEEQIRVFGTGHVSFFNSPLTALAMWIGRDESSSAFRRFLAKWDPYRNTAMGPGFKLGSASEEYAAEVAAHGLIDPHLNFIQNGFNTSMERDAVRIKSIRNYGNVQYGHPRFWEGIANEIRMLRNTVAARAVIINENNPRAAIDYLLRGEGKEAWSKFANAFDKEQKDFLLSEEGLMLYLFDGKSAAKETFGRNISLSARIEEVAGNGGAASTAIKRLIANGEFDSAGVKLRVPTAADSAANSIKNQSMVSKGRREIEDANQEFAAQLKELFTDQGDWTGINFKLPTSATFAETQRFQNVADWFFDIAVKFEKQTTMGPEWRMKYWDAIYELAPGLNADAVARLAEVAEKSLSPIVSWTGKSIGKEHKAWQAFKSATGKGDITLEEAHLYASNVAGKHVANLFYDASKKRLLYHQLRLILPFGQAWDDTIQAWGRIALDNPDQLYKVGKAMDFLTSSESSALYQLTDARDIYDPNQGFFFNDARSGERKLFVPFLGTGINIIANLGGQGRLARSGPYAFTATPQSFNFAFASGSIIPGVGPGITFALSLLDGLGKDPLELLPAGVIRDSAVKVVFPFGRPDAEQGVVETFLLSGNWRRMLGGGFVEAAYASAFGPTFSYLLNSGEYSIDDPEEQGRLVKDTVFFSKWFTTFRGFFGFISAAPLQLETLAGDGNGNTILATALFEDFRKYEIESGGNYNEAYGKILDLYGPQALFSMISSTTGAPTNLFTYELIQKNPEVVDKYSDVYGYFYPLGGLSQELVRWQKIQGTKERLSAQDILDRATSIRYYAAKDRLLVRAMAENWTGNRLDEAKKNLIDTYLMRGLKQESDVYRDKRRMQQLRDATNDPALATSDAVNGLRRYLFFRDEALKKAGKKPDGTLSSKGTIQQRIWLAEKAREIIEDNPEFYKMFYSFFRKELDVE